MVRKTIACVVLCFLLVFGASCGPRMYTGTVQIRDPNGTVLKSFCVETNTPMMLSVEDANSVVSSDSRTPGLVESLAVTLGFSKNSGVLPSDY